jgi:hypothetical protein
MRGYGRKWRSSIGEQLVFCAVAFVHFYVFFLLLFFAQFYAFIVPLFFAHFYAFLVPLLLPIFMSFLCRYFLPIFSSKSPLSPIDKAWEGGFTRAARDS